MQIENDLKLDFDDVLIRPKRSTLSSRSEVDVNRAFLFRHSNQKWSGVPIVASNMDTVGTPTMAKALAKHDMMTALHKFISVERLVETFSDPCLNGRLFYSLGVTKDDLEKYSLVKNELTRRKKSDTTNGTPVIPMVCIDVANGYSDTFVDFVKAFRKDNPNTVIMAGNVVTKEMVEQLIFSGADIVKCGLGSGSACTTRRLTGVGYPQLSTIVECSDAAHGLGGLVCADGGCRYPGDIAKAFGAGADFVMLGGMLAAHDESENSMTKKLFLRDDIDFTKLPLSNEDFQTVLNHIAGQIPHIDSSLIEKYKDFVIEKSVPNESVRFYGMSSSEAMNKHYGGVKDYRAPEGKSVDIPYRGPVDPTIKTILGGLRSSMTYIGAKRLKEMSKRTTFIRVTNQLNTVYGN